MAILNLVPNQTSIDFIKMRKVSFAVVIITTLTIIASLLFKGLNYGVDFKGGMTIELRTHTKPNIESMRDTLLKLNIGDVSLQEFGSHHDLLIRLEEQKDPEAVIQKIKSTLGSTIEYRKIETVGPKVGKEMVQKGFYAIIYALIAILIYIAVRFEWRFALCAIIALVHDCLIVLGMFSLFPLEFNETAITAILITASYSINDTIVVFDRVRENIQKMRKDNLTDILNKSINETLSRTLLTVLTTLLSVIALYFFGGNVISTFVLPIMIALLIGTLSSIFVASPLLLLFNIKHGKDLDIEVIPANQNVPV